MASPARNPQVTVCITAYNQSRYLAEAIESVLAQKSCECEVFVVDDASTDATPAIANRYNRCLTVVRNERTLGMVANWNKALTLGTAPYIALLHGDDLYLPDMLATAVRVLDSHPTTGYVYSAYYLIDEEGQRLELVRPFDRDHVWPGPVEFRHHLRRNYVQCPTVVVRRECYARLEGFDSRLVYAPDWEMWLRIETHGYQVGYVAEPLACWRLHPGSTTRNLERQGVALVQDEIAALETVFERLPSEYQSLQVLKRSAFYHLTKRYLLDTLLHARVGDSRAAQASLKAARIAYSSGANPGIVPFLLLESVRFLWRKRGERGGRTW